MSMDMMNARVSTYFDLMAQIEQLQAEAEAIKDELILISNREYQLIKRCGKMGIG